MSWGGSPLKRPLEVDEDETAPPTKRVCGPIPVEPACGFKRSRGPDDGCGPARKRRRLRKNSLPNAPSWTDSTLEAVQMRPARVGRKRTRGDSDAENDDDIDERARVPKRALLAHTPVQDALGGREDDDLDEERSDREDVDGEGCRDLVIYQEPLSLRALTSREERERELKRREAAAVPVLPDSLRGAGTPNFVYVNGVWHGPPEFHPLGPGPWVSEWVDADRALVPLGHPRPAWSAWAWRENDDDDADSTGSTPLAPTPPSRLDGSRSRPFRVVDSHDIGDALDAFGGRPLNGARPPAARSNGYRATEYSRAWPGLDARSGKNGVGRESLLLNEVGRMNGFKNAKPGRKGEGFAEVVITPRIVELPDDYNENAPASATIASPPPPDDIEELPRTFPAFPNAATPSTATTTTTTTTSTYFPHHANGHSPSKPFQRVPFASPTPASANGFSTPATFPSPRPTAGSRSFGSPSFSQPSQAHAFATAEPIRATAASPDAMDDQPFALPATARYDTPAFGAHDVFATQPQSHFASRPSAVLFPTDAHAMPAFATDAPVAAVLSLDSPPFPPFGATPFVAAEADESSAPFIRERAAMPSPSAARGSPYRGNTSSSAAFAAPAPAGFAMPALRTPVTATSGLGFDSVGLPGVLGRDAFGRAGFRSAVGTPVTGTAEAMDSMALE